MLLIRQLGLQMGFILVFWLNFLLFFKDQKWLQIGFFNGSQKWLPLCNYAVSRDQGPALTLFENFSQFSVVL